MNLIIEVYINSKKGRTITKTTKSAVNNPAFNLHTSLTSHSITMDEAQKEIDGGGYEKSQTIELTV